MKKLEKNIIFKDFEFINHEYEMKREKLLSIIDLFMDDLPDVAKLHSNEGFKKFEKNISNDNEQKSKDEIINERLNKKKINIPPDIKNLYHKIVMKTHPDKNSDYVEFYKRVVQSKNENDIAEIIYIAYQLNINEVFDLKDEYFDIIKNKIKEKEKLSSNINMNSFWLWYHTDSEELKKVMIDQIINTIKKGD